VRLGNFNTERTITFIPPDGEFELMKYRTMEHIKIPFTCIATISQINESIEYKVVVKSLYPRELLGKDVVIRYERIILDE
jgi:AP-2 complex subunit mu-1